jgi:CHAT domain
MIPADILNPPKDTLVADWLTQVETEVATRLEQISQANEATLSRLRAELLDDYFNVGGIAVNTFKAPTFAQQLWQTGINQAKHFLNQGETAAKVRENLLKLYFNAGVNVHQFLHSPTESQQLYQEGLHHAQIFLNQGETQAGVCEQTLRLYFNAAVNAQQALNYPQQAVQFYRQAIYYIEQFLESDAEITPGIGELTLKLYHNAGIIHLQLNETEQAIIYWQQGLSHTSQLLPVAESQPNSYELFSKLSENLLAAWGNQGQPARIIHTLPQAGLWLWLSLEPIKSPYRLTLLRNWHKHLENTPVAATITTAFQQLLHSILWRWHNPQQPHRHGISTEKLLALSESCYLIAQAREKQGFDVVYQNLHKLHHSSLVQEALTLPQQQRTLEQRLTVHWHKLGIKPATLDETAALQQLSWWQKQISQRKTLVQLKADIAAYHRLLQLNQLANHPSWQCTIERSEAILFEWLYTALQQQLNLAQSGLEDLPDIILGILLVSQSVEASPEQVIETWLQTPPWQSSEHLQAAFAKSAWQKLADASEPFLFLWLDFLGTHPTAQRLTIREEQINSEQPGLQMWLRELALGKVEKLATLLQRAWNQAQHQAKQLTPTFAEFIASEVTPTAYQQALIAQILGDVSPQLEILIKKWLSSSCIKVIAEQESHLGIESPPSFVEEDNQANQENSNPEVKADYQVQSHETILQPLNTLKQKFNRVISTYPPSHLALAELVSQWANARLAELLTAQATVQQIWETLERARVSLTENRLNLGHDWEERVGQALWNALATPLVWLEEGKAPTKGTLWPLLQIWLDHTGVVKLPSIETCQRHLLSQEALVQAFFDPVQRRLRLLWLDQHQVSLRDLPDAAAHQRFWTNPTTKKGGLLEQWTQGLSVWQQHQASKDQVKMNPSSHWDMVINSRQMQIVANCLTRWAQQQNLKQITVIFPAGLDQLPWEALPELETALVREISITHWLQSRSQAPGSPLLPTAKSPPEYCVITEPTNLTPCKAQEAQWVAQHFNTQLLVPAHSIFDVIQSISHSHLVHFALPIHFSDPQQLMNDLNSTESESIEWPSWIYTLLPVSAQLMVMLPGESPIKVIKSTGSITSPGIIPTLIAAGVKTIVGTLWPCPSLAGLCFSYHFYQIAHHNPDLPWHQVTAQARRALREMSNQDLQELVKQFDLSSNETCQHLIQEYQSTERPFNHPLFWAGLTVFGQVER